MQNSTAAQEPPTEDASPTERYDRTVPAWRPAQRRRAALLAASLVAVAAATSGEAAVLDLTGGKLLYSADPGSIENRTTVSLAGGIYTIDDPAEQAINLSGDALTVCAPFDSNTVTCPEAAVTSFDVRGGPAKDTIVLTGVVDPAVVRGDFDADTLIGGNADDTFIWSPGGGDDFVLGGPGHDTFQFFGSNASEIVRVLPSDNGGFQLLRNIANITLRTESMESLEIDTIGAVDDVSTVGLPNTDQIISDGQDEQADVLRIDGEGFCVTRAGDTFSFEGRQPITFSEFPQAFVTNGFCRPDPCEAAVVTGGCTVNGVRNQVCEGTAGDDSILGTRGADVIKGGGGKDRIRGGAGTDVICGEGGDDDLDGASDRDIVAGGSGEDRLKGGSGMDVLIGGDDDDDLLGSGDDDDLDGGAGDDRLRGGGDEDVLRGGVGDDRYDAGGGANDICSDPDQSGPFLRCP